MDRHPKDTGPRRPRGQAEKPRSSSPKDAAAKAAPSERKERIAKRLARAGVASRREVERLIGLGKVAVNGKLLDSPAVLVGRSDLVTVEGRLIDAPEATRVWRYHKPVGLLTSHRDPEGRPTVFEHLPDGLPRVISVGRLDLNSEGLLLLTNDGELARALEMPTTGWVRHYRARARGRVTQARLDRLKDGVTIDNVHYGPIEATLDKAKESADGRAPANLWISVSVTEGKYREVRKVLESVGVTVNRLIRLAYGPFQLGTLAAGEVEEVGPRVIREQLAAFISPENLPQGHAVASGPAGPAKSSRRVPATPLADPTRKPSRVRAQVEAAKAAKPAKPARREGPAARSARPEARDGREEAGARPVRKPGWAKPAPRRPGSDGPRTTAPRRKDDEGTRPERAPRRDGPDRAAEAGGRARFGPRPKGQGTGAKPQGARPQGSKPQADRPQGSRPQGARPQGSRPPSSRPQGSRPQGGKPSGPRPGGGRPRPR